MDRFGFYERVRIATTEPAKAEINGKLGFVAGKSTSPDVTHYAVLVYDLRRVWMCGEQELTSTGEFEDAERFYSGPRLRVSSRGELLGRSDSSETETA